MGLIPFDTLEFMDTLRQGGMSQSDAESYTRASEKAFRQIVEQKELATRTDLVKQGMSLRADIDKFRDQLLAEIEKTKAELRTELAQTKEELKADIRKEICSASRSIIFAGIGMPMAYTSIIIGVMVWLVKFQH